MGNAVHKRLLASHRWMTGVSGVPLVVWVLTGFAFTCFPFDVVSGRADRAEPEPLDEGSQEGLVSGLSALRRRLSQESKDPRWGRVEEIAVRRLVGKTVFRVRAGRPSVVALFDAATGEPLTLDETQAAAIAAREHRDHPKVVSVDHWASGVPELPGTGPLFRVRLGDARKTDVFVDEASGDVLAFRNDMYRRFDALWALHTWAFVKRSDPNQAPLRIAAGLSALAVFSGVALALRRLWGRGRWGGRSGPGDGWNETGPRDPKAPSGVPKEIDDVLS